MTRRRIIILLLLALIGIVVSYRQGIRAGYQGGIAASRASYLCLALLQGEVTREELCSTPAPEIKALRWHYAKERVQDEKWYQDHGWVYYPEVKCENEQMFVSMMDRTFTCDSGAARLLEDHSVDQPSSDAEQTPFLFEANKAFALEPHQACYGKKEESKLYNVKTILPDGRIVVEGRAPIQLRGVIIPSENKYPLCASQAQKFLTSRLEHQAILLYSEKQSAFPEMTEEEAYVVTQQGFFVNQELLRVGLGEVDPVRELRCRDLFSDMERVAREKGLGLWGEGCK